MVDQQERSNIVCKEFEELLSRRKPVGKESPELNWQKDGDANTNLFHRLANARRHRRSIKEMKLVDSRVVRDCSVENEVTGYYRRLYEEENSIILFLRG